MSVLRQQFHSLGALLIEKGLLTQDRLDLALVEQKQSGEKLGRILVARGWVRDRDIHLVLNGMMVVVFRLGGVDFGVETLLVREIARHQPSRPLPGAPVWLDGVCDYRGQVIPVLDLAARLGRPAAPLLDSARTIVYEGPGGRLWGLKVDSVSAVIQVASEGLDDPSAVGPDRGLDMAWLVGLAHVDGAEVVLLNVDALLAQGDLGSPAPHAQGGLV
ncbi:MAG: chemotaxis protein CheW [bacterium]